MTPPVSATYSLVGRLAGFDLGDGRGLPTRPLADAEWNGFAAVVRAQRVQGLLANAIDSGRWPATSEQTEEARTAHREAMASVLLLDRKLSELAPALDTAGIRWRALKGPAIAHLDEPDPSWRTYGDLDLLVAGQDFSAAVHLLAGLGGHRTYAQRSDDFDRRFGKGAAVVLPEGIEIDLHRTLALGPYGLALDPSRLFALPTESFRVGGARVDALSAAGRFLHTCYHSILGQDQPRISALRDVALTFPRDETSAREAHSLARDFGGEAVLATAVTAASSTLGWQPAGELARWSRIVQPNARDRRWLSAYRGPSSSSRRRTLLGLEAITDARTRMAYARCIIIDMARERAKGTDRRTRGPATRQTTRFGP